MIGYAISKNGVTIRLTEENSPEEILEGGEGELIAVKKFEDKHIIVWKKK